MPCDAVLQLDPPVQAVLGDTAIGDGGHVGHKDREIFTVRVEIKQRVEDGIIYALVHFDVRHQRVEHRRFLRKGQDKLAVCVSVGSKGLIAANGCGPHQSGRTGGPHHHQCLATAEMCFLRLVISHVELPVVVASWVESNVCLRFTRRLVPRPQRGAGQSETADDLDL